MAGRSLLGWNALRMRGLDALLDSVRQGIGSTQGWGRRVVAARQAGCLIRSADRCTCRAGRGASKREIDAQLLEQKYQDAEFLECARKGPETAIEQLRLSPEEDVLPFRITVMAPKAIALLATAGAIWIGLLAQDIAQSLVAHGSAAIGALAGLLAPFGG